MKMWSLLRHLFTLCISLSCVRSAAEVIRVFGYKGEEVHVSCPYTGGYESYGKYLCRNNCGYDDVLITTTERKKNKYSIYDDKLKRVFTATISDLSFMDAGKYWCGVTRTGKDIYTEVKLEVRQEWCCVKTNKMSGIVGRPVTLQCPYPPQHWDNRKFLCKGDHRNNCTDMVTSQSRFTLQDDVSFSSFLVVITEVEAEDAATYWCGSDSQWSPGNYTKIHLSVVFPPWNNTVVEPVGSQSPNISGKNIMDAAFFYPVVFIVSAVLLILIFPIVIVMCYKYICYKGQGAEVNMNRNQTMADIYENQDVVVCSKKGTSNPQSTCDQQSVYENFATTEDIYCNQIYI